VTSLTDYLVWWLKPMCAPTTSALTSCSDAVNCRTPTTVMASVGKARRGILPWGAPADLLGTWRRSQTMT
jgi:hypothetical protein